MNAADDAAGVFVAVAEFEVAEEKLDSLLSVATYGFDRSRADEPGCLRFDVTVPKGTPTCVLFHEISESRGAFDRHRTTADLERLLSELSAPVTRDKPVRLATRAASRPHATTGGTQAW